MTSKSHAVLFTKEGCAPCEKTKEHIYDILELNLDLTETLSFMKKENHNALVETYSLSLFPTLLIVGPNGFELGRITGGTAIREQVKDKLIEIYRDTH
jgi:hypothetical protein